MLSLRSGEPTRSTPNNWAATEREVSGEDGIRRPRDQRALSDVPLPADPGLHEAAALLGERWTLELIGCLLNGPMRFGQLRAALAGISANVLSRRLDSLVAAGVVAHERLPPPAAVPVYRLTPWGRLLEPALGALAAWSRAGLAREQSGSTTEN